MFLPLILGKILKLVDGGINVIYFLMEKELTVSIDAMKFSLGGNFWVVWIRRDQAGASPHWGTQDEQGQAKAPHPSCRGSHVGGAEQQDQQAESFRELVEKIPSHPGGQRPEKGLEGQICSFF